MKRYKLDRSDFYQKMKNTVIGMKPDDIEVSFDTVTKQNRKNLHACTLITANAAACPTFYFEDLYDAYRGGTSCEDIAESLFRFARKNRLDNLPGNIDIDDYACVRENLGLIVISEERNRDYLAGIVYEQIEDLALVPIIFTKDDNGIGNIKISRDFLEMWGLSAEDVMRDARERAPHVMPLTFRQLNEMVGDKEENGEELFVLSNCYFAGGAAVVFYPHVLECIGMALGRDLYLLPSSINEMIAITDNGQDPERLYEIVREVNRTQVSEADLLTDAVYYYKRDLNSFRRVRPA